jgi:hypothetical protein
LLYYCVYFVFKNYRFFSYYYQIARVSKFYYKKKMKFNFKFSLNMYKCMSKMLNVIKIKKYSLFSWKCDKNLSRSGLQCLIFFFKSLIINSDINLNYK